MTAPAFHVERRLPWASEGRPVYRGNQIVRQVHPYDAIWSTLLTKGLRATVPDQR
ncbi:MAG: hypothetical protein ACE5G0_10730 [Rhodothermales bacterium]